MWRVLITFIFWYTLSSRRGDKHQCTTLLNKWITPAIGSPGLCTKWKLRLTFVLHKTSTTPLPLLPRRAPYHADEQRWIRHQCQTFSQVNEYDLRSVWWKQLPLPCRYVNGTIGGVWRKQLPSPSWKADADRRVAYRPVKLPARHRRSTSPNMVVWTRHEICRRNMSTDRLCEIFYLVVKTGPNA